jgi:hypothetical protein
VQRDLLTMDELRPRKSRSKQKEIMRVQRVRERSRIPSPLNLSATTGAHILTTPAPEPSHLLAIGCFASRCLGPCAASRTLRQRALQLFVRPGEARSAQCTLRLVTRDRAVPRAI